MRMGRERERELYIAEEEAVAAVPAAGDERRTALIPGVDALCACAESLFCACSQERVIWRLDRGSLMPRAVCPGGPGMCALCCSEDGTRLYTLLAEADSVLLSDAGTGAAQVVSRCGCNPRRMLLCGDLLMIAGGEDGCVHGLDAETLESRFCLSMPGPVCDVAAACGRIYALCMTPTLSASLITVQPDGRRCRLPLEGMPGCLYMRGQSLLAATQGWLYALSADGRHVAARQRAPGRASAMMAADGLLLLDPLSGRLFAAQRGGKWRIAREHVRAAACCRGEESRR